MKFFKNKLFYFYSFIIYVILATVVFGLSSFLIEPDIRSFLISDLSANKIGSDNVVEIIIDDNSINEYSGTTDKMLIEIMDYLYTYAKPKIIGLDFFHPANKEYEKLLKQMNNVVAILVPGIENQELSQDKMDFLSEFSQKYSLETNEVVLSIPSKLNTISEYAPAKYLGSALIKKDDVVDKVVASSNLVKVGDSIYPSLALRMYLVLNNTNKVLVSDKYVVVPDTGLKIPYNPITEESIKTDIRYYARLTDSNGNEIDYTHAAVSAKRITDTYEHLKKNGKLEPGDIDPKLFDGTAVFVGVNQSGPYQDVLPTPMAERHPGVDIQATVLDNLLNNEFIYNASNKVNFIILLCFSLLAFVLIARLKFIKSLLLLIFLDVIFTIIVGVCAYHHYIVNYTGILSVQLVTLVFGYSFKSITENRNKEKIKQAMGKYLSQDIMKNVVKNIDDLKLGGKRAIVTVLFSDIRGFTSMSEKMSAEEVSMILNEYFSEMEPIISKYNGVINKFIGDAVMAIFGEPIQDINHAQNAVKCAHEMLKKVEYLREKWLFEGKPKFEIGVGINTGEVFIGNIGTENRMEYTVIGDTVNLASRIESYNKVYKTNLLVSSSTYEYISDIADVIKISEVQIRGKSKKMNIYEVLRIDRG